MKICIIKLGALGDVIRTFPIAIALKKKFPSSQIDWVTKENAIEIVQKCREINKVYDVKKYYLDKYDILYNFDIEKEAMILSKKINAKEKKGFYDENGYPVVFNAGAQYYLNTIFDDELKKNNKKTYQEMIFEIAELKYNKEKFNLELNENEKKYSEKIISKEKIKGRIIGIHIGSSQRWPSKAWHIDKIVEFSEKAIENGYEIAILAGPDDINKQKEISVMLERKKLNILMNNPHNSLINFCSIINACDYIICADSLALHISLALQKKTIALFFCTNPNEIEGYGLLKKIVSDKVYDFFPERMDEYNEELIKSIKAEEVLNAIKND